MDWEFANGIRVENYFRQINNHSLFINCLLWSVVRFSPSNWPHSIASYIYMYQWSRYISIITKILFFRAKFTPFERMCQGYSKSAIVSPHTFVHNCDCVKYRRSSHKCIPCHLQRLQLYQIPIDIKYRLLLSVASL